MSAQLSKQALEAAGLASLIDELRIAAESFPNDGNIRVRLGYLLDLDGGLDVGTSAPYSDGAVEVLAVAADESAGGSESAAVRIGAYGSYGSARKCSAKPATSRCGASSKK